MTFGELLKFGTALTMPKQLDDEVDTVERAQRVAHGGKKPEADDPGAPIAFLDADLGAELAGQMDAVLAAGLGRRDTACSRPSR